MGVYTNIDGITMDGAITTTWDEDEIKDRSIPIKNGICLQVDEIDIREAITKTEDEYGGWLVDLSKIPKGVSHIYIQRG